MRQFQHVVEDWVLTFRQAVVETVDGDEVAITEVDARGPDGQSIGIDYDDELRIEMSAHIEGEVPYQVFAMIVRTVDAWARQHGR